MADEGFDPTQYGAVAVEEPTPPQQPEFDPTQHGAIPVQQDQPSLLSKIGQAATNAALEFVPNTLRQVAGFAYSPIQEAPHALKEAYDVLRGVPTAQAVPESQTLVGFTKKPLEEQAKIVGGLTTQVGMLAAGVLGFHSVPKLADVALPKPEVSPETVTPEPTAPVATDAATQETIQPQPVPEAVQAPAVAEQPKIAATPEEVIANAIQEPSAGEILQRQPETVGEAGGERVGVEPSQQGQEVAQTGVQEPQVAPAVPQPEPTGITPEAQKLVDSGGVPGFVSKNLERIATENGITDIGNKTPNQIIDELKAKSTPTEGQAPAVAEQPKTETAAAPPTEPPPTASTTSGVTDEPHVSAIANRFTQERSAQGEIGEIAPGQGYSTRELADAGLKMSPEEINQHISDLVNKTGDPIKQGEAVRAEEARLSQRSNELSRAAENDPANMEKRIAADNAFKDLTDFHNGPVAQAKQNFHALGMSMQGELPVDLSTFNGLREAFLRDTGKPPSPEIEPKLRQMAEKVSNAVAEDNGAKQKLGQEIQKATRGKLPTADDVAKNIMDRMKVEPCRI